MQYMMTVRYYSLEERFISFIKLCSDTWSGLIAVIETFASVKKSIQFVDVACVKPDQAGLAYTSLTRTMEQDFLDAIITHAVCLEKTYR